MDIVTKDFPVSAGDPTDVYPHGTFEVVLSAPTLDRDGEVVDARAFEPLPDHITFDTDHSMTCDSVVGSGVPSYSEDGRLLVTGGYASDARSQTIRQKVADGHIRTTSVTFMAAERTVDAKGVPHVTKAELLNGTFTPIPSNRESVVLSAKSIVAHDVAEKVGARNSAKDAAAIQDAHDAMVTLGALCAAKTHTEGDAKDLELVGENGPEVVTLPVGTTPTSDTEQSADEAASDDAAEPSGEAAATDTAESADVGSDEQTGLPVDKSVRRFFESLDD